MVTRYVQAPAVLSRRTATAVILRTLSGSGTTLSGTGPAVWDALAVPSTADEIAAAMAERFDTSSDVVEHDIAALIAALSDHGLVVATSDG